MLATFKILAGRRGRRVLLGALVIGAMGLSAAPALAEGTWGITMTHANPYGLEAGLCPLGHASLEPDCGVDPFSGSGTSFARESGFDSYTIKVTNTSGTQAAPSNKVGSTLTCVGGPSAGASLAYQWLRNGVPIGASGEKESEYKLAAADEGNVIQCEVTASDTENATAAVSEGALVGPTGGEEVPPEGKVTIPSTAGKLLVGEALKCNAEGGASYRWLRNGMPITGTSGESEMYTLTAEDQGKALQCQVTENTSAGMIVAMSSSSDVVMAGKHDNEAVPPAAEALLPVATVVDQLPAGIVLSGQPSQFLSTSPPWTCNVLHGRFEGKEFEGPSAFRCSTSHTLKPGESYEAIRASVNVTQRAANPSTNAATVSGGGLVPASTTEEEGQTTIVPAVPFGISCFNVSILEEPQAEKHPCEEASSAKEPIQAGGHPFSVVTAFVLNYTTSALESTTSTPITPRLVSAGGAVKEVEAELPPGVVGNPQNVPTCPFAMLQGNECPADTAVGFTQATYDTAEVQGGKAIPFVTAAVSPGQLSPAHALVYNVTPTVGHPAEFGFVIIGRVPFVLEAKLRSNGDYGVSVGDSAIAEKVLGTVATFCEYGAHEVTTVNLVCNKASEAPPGSKPFLTNPTECSSAAPLWTLRADPWAEAKSYVSAQTGMNQLEGCGALQFHPELEVKPSPASEGGTSQADEPTGMTINLKVPQTNEANVKATPELKNIKMTLPEGITASPSAAHGLEACSNAQFGLETEFGPGAEERKKHEEEATGHFVPEKPAQPASCPRASQIGTVEVFTPLLSGAPTVEGTPPRPVSEHERLTCSSGMWGGSPTSLNYQWLVNGEKIEGATEQVLAFTPATVALDAGKPVQCQVTATNAAGSSVAVSRDAVVGPEPSPRPPFPPASIPAPSGTASEGNKLTCAAGTWTSTTAPAFTYKWLRDGVPITGASGEGYTLTSADQSKVIQCQVAGSNQTGAGKGGVTIADSAAVIASPEPSPAPPLPGAALQGQLFVGEPECSPCTEANHDALDGRIFRLFLQIQDPRAGIIVKAHGTTSVNEQTGQLTSTFLEQPQQPFELLQLKLKGGPTATLANPQTCGPAKTTSELTPWSAGLGGPSGTEPGSSEEGDFPSSAFNVEGCSAAMAFDPAFNGGTVNASAAEPNATAAGASPSFSLGISREDGEQDLSGVTVHMPLGLVGKIAGIPRCGEAQANAGTCGPESEIGTAEAGAGPGPDPFFNAGRVYLTGPTTLKNGVHGPFGLSIVTPAVAGPFNLGNVVVRSAIDIDPRTAAVTVTSDPLPQFVDGVQLRLRRINVSVHKHGFMLNPTNCSAQQVSATLTSAQGGAANVASPFGLAGCKSLAFHPIFTATTNGKTSKTEGASLDVKITYPPGAYANIAKSVTELPIALPSRLTTIQKACPDTVFEANPATCPEGSVIGQATAYTPLLEHPLTGPGYLVSHGNRAFPDLEVVLQGEGITVDLDGLTDIKKGITKTTFESLPDSPISRFELNLPEGPHSALAAPANLCEKQPLLLPTILTGQNGAVLKQNTNIAVTGCPPTITISKAKLDGNALLVTVKLSAKGTVKISGKGLKTVTNKNLNAGTHKIRVAFTKVGKSLRKHHKKTSVRVSLTVGKQAVAKASTVRL